MRLQIRTLQILACLSLAACGGQAPEASVEHRERVKPSVALPGRIDGFALGTYVDPATFQVGGQTTEFSTDNYIYAVVGLKDQRPNDSVKVTITDQSKEIVSAERVVSASNEPTLTFDLNAAKLTPGRYSAAVFLNGQRKTEKELIVK